LFIAFPGLIERARCFPELYDTLPIINCPQATNVITLFRYKIIRESEFTLPKTLLVVPVYEITGRGHEKAQ
jgi:hypothetical protein